MKKLLVVALMLVGTLAHAHPTSTEEDKQVYNYINTLLEEGKINVKTAQSMWIAYHKCCEE